MLPTEPRDLALGRYMDTWSRMEGMLYFILRYLLRTDDGATQAITAALTARQWKDLLTAMGVQRLTDEGSKRLTNLCERFSKHNTKRNNIVHGSWALTVHVKDAGDGRSEFTTTWVRSYRPVQQDIAKDVGRYDLPAIGGKTAFTIPQMATATTHVEALMGDLSTFLGELPSLQKPPPPPDPEPS